MIRLLRNVFRLVLLLAVVGGGFLAWTYYRSDELLREEILRRLSEALPDAEVRLERANFDLQGRIRIFDLTIVTPGDSRPALTIAETTVAIDRQQFTDHQRVVIESLRVSQPRVRVVRRPDGTWNWLTMAIVKPRESNARPDIEVLHGVVELVLPDHASRTMINFPLDNVMVRATPTSHNSYRFQLSGRCEVAGGIQLQGELPLVSAPWSVTASLAQCRWNNDTARFAQITIPGSRAKFEEWEARLVSLLPRSEAGETSTAPPFTTHSGPSLGIDLTGAMKFQLHGDNFESIAPVTAVLEIESGELNHSVLPSPWFGLTGKIDYSAGRWQVQELSVRNGQSQLTVDASFSTTQGLNLLIQPKAIPIEESLIARLPDALQRHVRALELTGTITGQVQLQRPPNGVWQIDAEGSIEQGTVRHEKFPYLVHDVSGTASWHHDTVVIQARGTAGTRPVQLTGTIHNPGPVGSATFDIRADDLVSDEALLAAMPTSVSTVIRELQFQGRGDVWVRLLRPEGLDQKYEISVLANIRDASLQYSGFPYQLTQTSGRLIWHGDVIKFESVRGRHVDTVVSGDGRFELSPHPGRLTMNVRAVDAVFDRALYGALPTVLQTVWAGINPQGAFDATAVVEWVPGHPAVIDVPRLQVKDGGFELRDFPYPFRKLQGVFAYQSADQRVTITDMTAQHDDTRINGQGTATIHNDGTVTLAFERFHVDDLSPAPALRRALPPSLREVVELLNPAGRYSFHGPLKLYADQSRGGLVGAEWDFQIVLAGCAINAGIRLDNIHGRLKLQGRWTPRTTDLVGELDLDGLSVFVNHQLTRVRGPFKLQDGILTAGSAEMVNSARGNEVARVARTQRITAELFDGQATLDAIVDLNHEPSYRASMEVTGASLEKYAVKHLRGYSSVRGLMNGWMDLEGKGTEARGLSGEGQLQISPAALYELPVFLQIFQLPQFAPINRTAFDYANFLFRIENERFNFQNMDLVGNTISLRGRGVVRFDGAVLLDFYSMQPRNQVRVPGLRELVGVVNMVSQGWIAIEVRGPIHAPVARVVPFPAVDGALQQFLAAFNPRTLVPPPLTRGPPPRTTFAPETPRQ